MPELLTRSLNDWAPLLSARGEYPMSSTPGERFLSGAIILAGVLLMLFGVAVLLYQGCLWLKDGDWTPISFAVAWYSLGGQEPMFQWQGVQKLAVWLLEAPLSAVSLLTGVL